MMEWEWFKDEFIDEEEDEEFFPPPLDPYLSDRQLEWILKLKGVDSYGEGEE